MNNKEAKQLMKLHNHKFGYCSICGPMIYCGYCGNNSCNGGKLECKDKCNEAYEIMNIVTYPLCYRIRGFYQFTIVLIYQIYIKVPISDFFYRMRNENNNL
jgi:hypothetical protein